MVGKPKFRLLHRRIERLMAVYFINQEERGQWLMKIGRATDIRRRLGQLQTGNPKQLALVGWIESMDDARTEKALHRKYTGANVGGEWFALQPADILSDLQAAGIEGFVAKNADALEITGRYSDAVAEYLGVWVWADLEIDECCPFCGCLCGMTFQDGSQMYHCLSCDTLTDFSELSPDFDSEEDYLAWKAQEAERKARLSPPRHVAGS